VFDKKIYISRERERDEECVNRLRNVFFRMSGRRKGLPTVIILLYLIMRYWKGMQKRREKRNKDKQGNK